MFQRHLFQSGLHGLAALPVMYSMPISRAPAWLESKMTHWCEERAHRRERIVLLHHRRGKIECAVLHRMAVTDLGLRQRLAPQQRTGGRGDAGRDSSAERVARYAAGALWAGMTAGRCHVELLAVGVTQAGA